MKNWIGRQTQALVVAHNIAVIHDGISSTLPMPGIMPGEYGCVWKHERGVLPRRSAAWR